MKLIWLVCCAAILTVGCGNNEQAHNHDQDHDHEHELAEGELPSTGNFGAVISEDGAIDASELLVAMEGQDSVEVKVKGLVLEACQVSGCWMNVEMVEGEKMRVVFKDYGFFIPKDAAGKSAIVEGIARKKLVPVEELRHYAEDAGESEDVIAAITEPEEQIEFEAVGVIIE